jgi:hypothetical protein
MSIPSLNYSVTPTSLLVSQTQQLVLTVSNPSGSPVSFGLDFAITLTLPVGSGASDLVNVSGAPNVTAAVQDASWSQNVDYDANSVTVTIFPARTATLPANGQLVVLVSTVAVNAVANSPGAALTVQAATASESGPLQSLDVAKINAGMTVSAYANPVAVGQGESTTILWSASGGSHIQLLLNGQVVQDQPFSGQGPVWSGSFEKAKPFPNTPQTTYEVTVFNTSGSQSMSTPVLIGLEPPLISYFRASAQKELAQNQKIDLSWSTQYGAAAYLSPAPSGSLAQVTLDAQGHSVTPSDWLLGAPNDSSAKVTLSVTGYLTPAKRTLDFSFAPAAFEYFSYASQTSTSGGVVGPIVSNGSANLVSGPGNSWTSTLVGPGGPLTRTVGGSAPTVNYFGPYGTTLSAPDNVTLSYWVQGMQPGDTLTLNGTAVSVDASGKGSTVVSPTTTTSYTLLAVLSGQRISNTLTITIQNQEAP